MSINDDLADAFVIRAIDLNRFAAGVRRDVLRILLDLEDELAAELARFDPSAPTRSAFQQRRLEALQEQTRKTIATAYRDMRRETDKAIVGVVQSEAVFARHAVQSVIGVDMLSVSVPPVMLETIARDILVPMGVDESQPLAVWWGAQEDATRRRFVGTMRNGILRGETLDELVNRVRGIPLRDDAGKIIRQRGQALRGPAILDVSRRDATTLVRTAVQTGANQTRQTAFERNPDVVRGMAASTTLDLRTSAICIARTGAAWDLDGKPLPESTRQEPYPGPPPWHPNCRSTIIAVLHSLADILRKAQPAKRAGVRDLEVSTRSSIDGQVPMSTTFETFLKKRSAADQRKILGAGKWRLWQEGKLSLSEMIDETGRPLSLAELNQRAAA